MRREQGHWKGFKEQSEYFSAYAFQRAAVRRKGGIKDPRGKKQLYATVS